MAVQVAQVPVKAVFPVVGILLLEVVVVFLAVRRLHGYRGRGDLLAGHEPVKGKEVRFGVVQALHGEENAAFLMGVAFHEIHDFLVDLRGEGDNRHRGVVNNIRKTFILEVLGRDELRGIVRGEILDVPVADAQIGFTEGKNGVVEGNGHAMLLLIEDLFDDGCVPPFGTVACTEKRFECFRCVEYLRNEGILIFVGVN